MDNKTQHKLYRLLSGKISRYGIDKESHTHKAPFDFVPTANEFEANKFRLKEVGEVAEDSSEYQAMLIAEPVRTDTSMREAFLRRTVYALEQYLNDLPEPFRSDRRNAIFRIAPELRDGILPSIPAHIPANNCIRPALQAIDQLTQVTALQLIESVESADEIEKLVLQETQRANGVRAKVLKALDLRREELLRPATSII